MQNNYTPSPVDTTGVKIPDEIMELVEMLAENTHEVWAKGRMDEGWTYGPVRNDALKQHPCLVPYSELPENEKEYDRSTSMETVRFILGKGFEIKKP